MHFTLAIATVVVVVFGSGVRAVPLTASDAAALASKFPVSSLDAFGIHSNTTLGRGSLRPDAATDPILIVCGAENCAESCTSFDLAVLPNDLCLPALTNQFVSAGISNPTNAGLPFAVVVGTTNCVEVIQLPATNECFNLQGAVFNSYARVV
ncbi:hypothetical protein C8Q79DRAFT_136774 [Trametes meyenii]|nr:hypothetical protein C8Q79DRAFT_136774 [Trametes meyenii]